MNVFFFCNLCGNNKLRVLCYNFNIQVRSEARKVHDLFFDILKIAFPDTDFREVRNSLSFTSTSSTSTAPSPRQANVGQSKRQKQINEVEPEPSPPQKVQQRKQIFNNDSRLKIRMPQKESKHGSGRGSSREQYQQDDSPLLAHPGDLVICKKKRKDREKSTVKGRNGSAGPVSPPSMGHSIKGSSPGLVSKDTRKQTLHSQGWPGQSASANGVGGSGGWANPVKRLRTDSGKRRPSHL